MVMPEIGLALTPITPVMREETFGPFAPLLTKQLAFGLVYMDAVSGDGLISQQVKFMQTLNNPLAILTQAVFLVGFMFGSSARGFSC